MARGCSPLNHGGVWGFVPFLPNSRHIQHSQQSTPQLHNKRWHSGNLHHYCLGGGPHGWVAVNTHSTPVLPKWEEAVGSSQAPQPNKPNTHKSHAQLPQRSRVSDGLREIGFHRQQTHDEDRSPDVSDTISHCFSRERGNFQNRQGSYLQSARRKQTASLALRKVRG